ncbi:MAG: flagellar basal body P-ring formation protein FlgA [Oligoflexales bacterium]|nr:flagellar basal body P-ring formation protein FlgA [Oligoflexales bacterium]
MDIKLVSLKYTRWFNAFLVGMSISVSSYSESINSIYNSKEDEESAFEDVTKAEQIVSKVNLPILLQLIDNVEINDDRIYLGEISRCTGDAYKCDESYGVDLGEAPRPCQSIRISTDHILKLLKVEWPDHIIKIDSPSSVIVRSSCFQLQETVIKKNLEELVFSKIAGEDEIKVDIDRILVPLPVKVRNPECVIKFPTLEEMETLDRDFLFSFSKNLTQINMSCGASKFSKDETTFPIKIKLNVYMRYPFALRDLSAGTTVNGSDFSLEWKKVSQMPKDVIKSLDTLTGLELKQFLRAGEYLTPAKVGKAMLIKQGQEIKIRVNIGELKIFAKGKALSKGGMGDQIMVQYVSAKKNFEGRIAGPSLVEVNL